MGSDVYEPDPPRLESTLEGIRKGDGWEVVLPSGKQGFIRNYWAHEIFHIHVSEAALLADPNFPKGHPIWKLPTVSEKGILELYAEALSFHGYFDVYLPNGLTCLVHEDQAYTVEY